MAAGPEILTRPPEATYETRRIVPARALYLARNDRVRIRSINSVDPVAVGADPKMVTISGRILRPDGEIHPFGFSHTPNTNRTAVSEEFSLGEAWLLNMHAAVAAGPWASSGGPGGGPTVRRGHTFVTLGVVRGAGALVADPHSILAAGYVGGELPVSWPDGRIDYPTEGPGILRSVTGTDPAAGTEASETVPTGARWRLRSFRIQLVTNGLGTARQVRFNLDDGANIFQDTPVVDTQPLSSTRNYDFLSVIEWRGTPLTHFTNPMGIPDVMLFQGYRIRTATNNLDGGDNYGAPQMLIEEWLEP